MSLHSNRGCFASALANATATLRWQLRSQLQPHRSAIGLRQGAPLPNTLGALLQCTSCGCAAACPGCPSATRLRWSCENYVRLPVATQAYLRLPKITQVYLRLSKVTRGCLRLPKAIQGYVRIFEVIQSYLKLPKVTYRYLNCPSLPKAT